MNQSDLYKLNKDMLIKILVNANNLNSLSDLELEDKMAEILNILSFRRKEKEIFPSLRDIYQDEEDIGQLFDNLKNKFENGERTLRDESNDDKNEYIQIVCENDSIFMVYRGKRFFPTLTGIAEVYDKLRFLHRRDNGRFDFLVIISGEGTLNDPYKIITGEDYIFNHMLMDSYYLTYEEKSCVYL